MTHTDTADGPLICRHDPTMAPGFTPAWFEDDWLARHAHSREQAPAGRGDTRLLQIDGMPMVLRRYRRGGLVRHLNRRHYLYTGLERTRAMREFAVLQALALQGLPAPRVVAARVHRHALVYTASLLMCRLPGVTLGSLLEQRLPAVLWQAVGCCLRRFHDAGLWHADLNAHNILVHRPDAAGEAAATIWLIDFDRARWRDAQVHRSAGAAGITGWRQANLQRLQRSLEKLCGIRDGDDWQELLTGYRRASSVAAR